MVRRKSAMQDDDFIPARRRLEEAEKRLADVQDALRAAREQGRVQLLATLQTLIDAEAGQVESDCLASTRNNNGYVKGITFKGDALYHANT